MCLTDFKEFKTIRKSNPLIGYRTWRLTREGVLLSEYKDYKWKKTIEGPHKVTEKNSGIYAYYYNYNNNYNYISGIIQQYGKIAIHSIGQRSSYAKIQTFFTIRKSDAIDPKEFLDWIDKFNSNIEKLA